MNEEQLQRAMKAVNEDLPKRPEIVMGLIGQTVIELISERTEPSTSAIVRALEQTATQGGLKEVTAKEAILVISLAEAGSGPD
jgi:hypothetical protein